MALMATISAVLVLISYANSHAMPLPTDANHNRHICDPNPCDSGSFCLKCHPDSGICKNETDRQKGFVCLSSGNHLDGCHNHRCHNKGKCEKHPDLPHRYRCRCQPGFIGEFCEVQIRVRRSRDSKKVPQVICVTNDTCGKFGSCLPKPNSPDFECICDDAHMGSKCEYNKVAVAVGACACGCCGLGGLACNCGGGGGGGGDCPNDCNCDCPADCNCDCPAVCVGGCNCADDCCKPDEDEDEQQPQVPITSPPETSTV